MGPSLVLPPLAPLPEVSAVGDFVDMPTCAVELGGSADNQLQYLCNKQQWLLRDVRQHLSGQVWASSLVGLSSVAQLPS